MKITINLSARRKINNMCGEYIKLTPQTIDVSTDTDMCLAVYASAKQTYWALQAMLPTYSVEADANLQGMQVRYEYKGSESERDAI